MPQSVTLPSGRAVELEPPQLRRLLWYGELGVRQLAAACMDRADCRAGDLDAEDALCVACWGLEHLDSDDAMTLAAVCELYGVLPSVYLRVTDRVLAFEADRALTVALETARKRDEQEAESGGEIAPDDPVYGFPREDR